MYSGQCERYASFDEAQPLDCFGRVGQAVRHALARDRITASPLLTIRSPDIFTCWFKERVVAVSPIILEVAEARLVL